MRARESYRRAQKSCSSPESPNEPSPMPQVILLGPSEESRLATVLPGVFDGEVLESRLSEFLGDPRHHIAVALEDEVVVGFASAVHYVHPDKDPELWINEVGVALQYRRRGLGRALLGCLLEKGAELGCKQAWVLTERDNGAAVGLYESVGGSSPESETVMYSFRLDGRGPPTSEGGAC